MGCRRTPGRLALGRPVAFAALPPASSPVTDDSTCSVFDEVGYLQHDARGGELLSQILTEREEKASVAVGSNLPFSEWGKVIADPCLVAAIVDRVTFNAHIIEPAPTAIGYGPAKPGLAEEAPWTQASQVGPTLVSTVGPIPVDKPMTQPKRTVG